MNTYYNRTTDNSWETGVKVVKKMTVIIPRQILLSLLYIDSRFPEVEFAVVTNIDRKNSSGDVIVLSASDIYIPKQEVSVATVKFDDPAIDRYEAVIHKHPSKSGFSGVDDHYLNSNIYVSLVYHDGEFCDGIVNLKIDNGIFIQVPAKIEVEPEAIQPVNGLENIRKPTYSYYQQGSLYSGNCSSHTADKVASASSKTIDEIRSLVKKETEAEREKREREIEEKTEHYLKMCGRDGLCQCCQINDALPNDTLCDECRVSVKMRCECLKNDVTGMDGLCDECRRKNYLWSIYAYEKDLIEAANDDPTKDTDDDDDDYYPRYAYRNYPEDDIPPVYF